MLSDAGRFAAGRFRAGRFSGAGDPAPTITGTAPSLAAMTEGDTLADAVTWGSATAPDGETLTGASPIREQQIDGAAWEAYAGATAPAAGATVAVRERWATVEGTTAAFTSATQIVAYLEPTITQQPQLAATYERGAVIDLLAVAGAATPAGAVASIEALTYNGADISGGIVAGDYNTSGLSAYGNDGALALQIRWTNGDKSALSDVDTATLIDVPAAMAAPDLGVDSSSQITATLAAAPDNGNSAITGYDLRWQADEGAWTEVLDITSPHEITGLDPATLHNVQTRAVNAVGNAAWSASASATTDAGEIITQTTAAVIGPYVAGDLPTDAYTPGTYESSAEAAPPSFDIGAVLFGASEPGDEFTFYRDFCYTKSAGGVYELVTTTGDQIARVLGPHNGITLDQDDTPKRPLYGESGAIGWGLFDGIDDCMQTGIITPGTDKVQVFVGARKVDDATIGMLVEHGPGPGDGKLFLASPLSTSERYGALSRGTANTSIDVGSNAAFDAPHTAVLTLIADISAPSVLLRIDGTQEASSTSTQGTGNYLAYPVNIGARNNGASLHFDGPIYSVIPRWGPTPIIGTIEDVEAYINGRMPA